MMPEAPAKGASWFQRYLLPGFAMKAVIIGGGYATGRELAEFFVPAGPWGGLLGMLLASVIWSIVAALTFALAVAFRAHDYRTFFQRLLGRAWVVFELAYIIFVVLILAVFGAAAGAIGAATLGWPEIGGSVLLAVSILAVTSFGERAVEELFKYASLLIYAVYLLFIVFAFANFGEKIGDGFRAAPPPSAGWATGGVTYAAYNIVGAVVIVPVLRHLTRRRDAAIAGVIAGPLAMLPAVLFFIAMMAFYPAIGTETLPSDFLLRQMAVPGFNLIFQLMIFAALLESGAGAVHAINERVSTALEARRQSPTSRGGRALIGGVILAVCMFVAARIGLVDLIASGYRLLAALFLLVYVLPLLTLGTYRLFKHENPEALP